MSRFDCFRWIFRILRKILHRYSAPEFHQATFPAKLTVVCMRLEPFLQFWDGKKCVRGTFRPQYLGDEKSD